MHHRPLLRSSLLLLVALPAGLALAACSATSPRNDFEGEGGDNPIIPTGPGQGGAGGAGTSSGGQGGIDIIEPTTSSSGAGGSIVPIDPCNTSCGPEELCDDAHLGTDDNCNGTIDEGCSCSPGQAKACFKGDPAKRNTAGCFDGTQACGELGTWGPCVGGVHATTDPADAGCYAGTADGCQAITAVPFADVALKTGTGSFSTGATNESWTVTCPAGITSCPGVTAPDGFKPLQSGEYTVTYTRTVGGAEASCTYPLIVGDRGLRVELEWEHTLGGTGVDIDLHMHQPGTTYSWSMNGEKGADCGYANCTADEIDGFGNYFGSPPKWFADTAPFGEPVNWYKDPDPNKNSCYFAPRGKGKTWKDMGKGCHNPRLDLDNITCDPSVTNVDSSSFCAPENINVDFPPTNAWTRIGAYYYNNKGRTYDVHPVAKIYCDGALAAELGTQGYNAPVTFSPNDAPSDDGQGNRFWAIADVYFPPKDSCGRRTCVVEPLYADSTAKTPLFMTKASAESGFGPGYPPIPSP